MTHSSFCLGQRVPLARNRPQRIQLAYGYRTNLWTTARIAELVEHEFGVRYHRDHVGRLMHSLGWSPQKPERRALERDEEEIARWKREEWPCIKKRRAAGCPRSLCRRIGLSLIPHVVRTLAPQGRTPIYRHRQGRRDKISVISGISLSPRRYRLNLFYLLFYDNIGQEEVCLFLRELLRHLSGLLIVLLDNSATHKGAPIEQRCRRHRRLLQSELPSFLRYLSSLHSLCSSQ